MIWGRRGIAARALRLYAGLDRGSWQLRADRKVDVDSQRARASVAISVKK